MAPETEELIETIDRLMQIEGRPFAMPMVGQPAPPRPYGIQETINVLCTAIQDRLAPNRPKPDLATVIRPPWER